MKIIIEHSKTKREIAGPFNICGSRSDLLSLATQIQDRLEDRPHWSYGWINIRPLTETQESIADTPPTGWDA